MNNMFNGFGTVFKYNFNNHVKSSKYIVVTVIFALVLILGIGGLIVFLSKPSDEEKSDKIEKVYIFNETDMGIPSYSRFAQMAEDEETAAIVFEKMDGSFADFADTTEETDYIAVIQTKQDEDYLFKIVYGEDCEVGEDALNKLGLTLTTYYKGYLYQMTGLSEEALYQILLPTACTVSEFEEEEDEGRELFRIIAVFVLIMVMYFIILIYGQQVCTDVSLEKTSKLTEQILVSVGPYALVGGKIFASIVSSMLQFMIWVISIIIGIFGGDKVASSVFDIEESKISVFWGMLKEWFAETDFGTGSIILSVIAVLVGITLFLIMAGLAGSMVTKPEEAQNMQSVYILPMVVCYFVVLLAVVKYEGNLPLFYHMIPFTAAFVTPGALLTGAVSILFGVVSIVISIIVAALLMVAAAKIYKSLMFYNGNKLKIKDIISIVFKK